MGTGHQKSAVPPSTPRLEPPPGGFSPFRLSVDDKPSRDLKRMKDALLSTIIKPLQVQHPSLDSMNLFVAFSST